MPRSRSSHPGQARSWIGTAEDESDEGSEEPEDEPEGEPEDEPAGEPDGAGDWTSVGRLEVAGRLAVPTDPPPPDPPVEARTDVSGRPGDWGAVGTADIDCRSGPPDGCNPLVGPGSTTSGPVPGSASHGVRLCGVVSSVALPAATTIIVGTEVSATSSAEMSSGLRFEEKMR